jgi:hypothetical protein
MEMKYASNKVDRCCRSSTSYYYYLTAVQTGPLSQTDSEYYLRQPLSVHSSFDPNAKLGRNHSQARFRTSVGRSPRLLLPSLKS